MLAPVWTYLRMEALQLHEKVWRAAAELAWPQLLLLTKVVPWVPPCCLPQVAQAD